MRPTLIAACLLITTLAVSCRTSPVKGYWKHHTPDISDIRAAEKQFASFAERALESPEADSRAEIDRLFNLLLEDEVAYYVYTEWVVRAFYTPASPCRDCNLFVYSIDRIMKDGIIDGYDAVLFQHFANACKTNRIGDFLTLPQLLDRNGSPSEIATGEPTIFLVIDLSCPSCLKALEKMAGFLPQARHIALCSGPGRIPEIAGWTYYKAVQPDSVYDTGAAPFYFVADGNGIIETSYTIVL